MTDYVSVKDLSVPAVTAAVVGARTADEIRADAGYLRVPIPDALWADLGVPIPDALWADLGVPIPDALWADLGLDQP